MIPIGRATRENAASPPRAHAPGRPGHARRMRPSQHLADRASADRLPRHGPAARDGPDRAVEDARHRGAVAVRQGRLADHVPWWRAGACEARQTTRRGAEGVLDLGAPTSRPATGRPPAPSDRASSRRPRPPRSSSRPTLVRLGPGERRVGARDREMLGRRPRADVEPDPPRLAERGVGRLDHVPCEMPGIGAEPALPLRPSRSRRGAPASRGRSGRRGAGSIRRRRRSRRRSPSAPAGRGVSTGGVADETSARCGGVPTASTRSRPSRPGARWRERRSPRREARRRGDHEKPSSQRPLPITGPAGVANRARGTLGAEPPGDLAAIRVPGMGCGRARRRNRAPSGRHDAGGDDDLPPMGPRASGAEGGPPLRASRIARSRSSGSSWPTPRSSARIAPCGTATGAMDAPNRTPRTTGSRGSSIPGGALKPHHPPALLVARPLVGGRAAVDLDGSRRALSLDHHPTRPVGRARRRSPPH